MVKRKEGIHWLQWVAWIIGFIALAVIIYGIIRALMT